ncbi:glycoside hydrolase superfamily [Mucor mucedo]|uniref:glycoside hydrolase superfamily n=1 Tax=Mucor mucedo TaxID=29922 RepID=UPI00221FC872|nr:glycoside hydrolase superfamily [Mucor mucedo]KAI7895405.1 glycoside hydrolase superfamily [Mucor mucedo]
MYSYFFISILFYTAVVHANVLSWDEAYIKAALLVDQMSLDQKVAITTGRGWANGPCGGNTYPISSPHFPSLCLQDGPLGVRGANNVTSGVAGINAAASFDKMAIRARADYLGKEFRGKGIHVQLGPAVNMMRSPKSGRAWEGSGEDPYLAGIVAAESIKGVQAHGVIANVKHYILNDQELNRMTSSSEIDARTLHEIHLWPFARSVEAGVGSVMCSFNKISGIHACENDYLLNTVLKGELGFKGFVVSDWWATHSTVQAANGGLDMTMPGDITLPTSIDKPGSSDSYFGKNLTDAVIQKDVSESRATDMAMRIVASWYKMHQDENFPQTQLSFDQRNSPFVNVQENHRILVREMGAASNVLLKNLNFTLPIVPSQVKSIAVIGSDAGPPPNGINTCFLNYCSNGTLAQGWGSGTADFPYLIDPLQGLREVFGDAKIKSTLNDWDLHQAAEIAKDADFAFVFSNADSGEGLLGIYGDRKNLSLWQNGDNLIKAVADANSNTIVVIHSVGPVLMPWIDHPNIKAVLWPGLPGQVSGHSLADIVTGKVNPSGRLPYTIAKREEDYNVDIDLDQVVEYSERLLMGYKWFDHAGIEPLFPFGYGLSYTSFDYDDLKVKTRVFYNDDAKKIVSDAIVRASINVRNCGTYDGAEIVQAYLSFPKSANSPPQQLRGFEKIFLQKGQNATVEFDLRKTELSIWDVSTSTWVIPAGEFAIGIGASSRDIRMSIGFTF